MIYIKHVAQATMAINTLCNKHCGPGGSTRRLHHKAFYYGGEIGLTDVVKTKRLPGIVPPLSGYFKNANDNHSLAVAA